MKRPPYLYLLVLITWHTIQAQDSDWDFESGRLDSWKRTGESFSQSPFRGNPAVNYLTNTPCFGETFIGQHGTYWVTSFNARPFTTIHSGDAAQGELISPEFRLTTRYISYLLGGLSPAQTCRVELAILDDGRFTKSFQQRIQKRYGPILIQDVITINYPIRLIDGKNYVSIPFQPITPNSSLTGLFAKDQLSGDVFVRRSFTLPDSLRGKAARLILVDNDPNGHLNIDDIRFENIVSPSPVVIQGPAAPSLWGFADFHTHPASHLAWGDPGDGHTLFWGKPGMALDQVSETSLRADLPPCNHQEHSWDDGDLGRVGTRKTILNSLTFKAANFVHGPGGYPDFKGWPHARNGGVHQQMHISWVKRAYDGGLRLIVASAVDNQTLATLWRQGLNLLNSKKYVPEDADYRSAIKQIDFIREWVGANSSWMQICRTPAEARAVIGANKMAVIIGTEMDGLTPAQLDDLISRYDVRCVTPVHFTNNEFGGCAVYSELFNANNQFINGYFHRVVADPSLTFRFDRAKTEQIVATDGVLKPKVISDVEYKELGYDCYFGANRFNRCLPSSGGQRNAQGIRLQHIVRLMQKGVIIDIAHMSYQGQEELLSFCEREGVNYPLMNSHTGIRVTGGSERAMAKSHAERLLCRGGVIGMGLGAGVTYLPILNLKQPAGFTTKSFSINFEQYVPVKALQLILDIPPVVLLQNDPWRLVIRLKSGAYMYYDLSFGTSITDSKCIWYITLPPTILGRDLSSIEFQVNKFSATSLELNKVLSDPVADWTVGFNKVGNLFKRGVGVGSDFNGLDNVIPFTTQQTNFPITYNGFSGRPLPPIMQHKVGNKTFDFKNEGLAHIGLYPDLFQLVSQTTNGQQAIQTLFRSANDYVVMWEAVERESRQLEPVVRKIIENVYTLDIEIGTGDDDLRGDNDNAFGFFQLRNGAYYEFPLNKRMKWDKQTTNSVTFELPYTIQPANIEGFGIRTELSGGFEKTIGTDDWQVNKLRIRYRTALGQNGQLYQSETPIWFKGNGSQYWWTAL